ncbi:MAG TPA: DUF1592 domain-containing protein [Polyangiaceae bacterium]|nr:DUF1592 domain-containing protein [Polyangiaceae bacterium]
MHRHIACLGMTLLAAAAFACSAENGAGGAELQGGSPGSDSAGTSTAGTAAGQGGTNNAGGRQATSGGNGGNPTSSSGGVSAGGSGGVSTGGSTAPTTASCPSSEVTRTPLRRLTRIEYANSVKSLLGVDPAPADALPADEVTDGFSNNAEVLTVSPLHAEKYVLVSEALAKAAVTDLARLTACDAVARGEQDCALDFARRLGRRAFRRPTTPEDEQFLMTQYSAGRVGGSYAEGIEVMIRAALQSPHFLYKLETLTPADSASRLVPLNQFELATRLSYLIWASGPDDALLDAAQRGELASKQQIASRARSMLQDPQARTAIADFYGQWVGASRLAITTKSPTQFPSFTPAVRDAMAQELPAFISYLLWTGDHKFSTLLTSQVGFVNAALAPSYGLTATGTALSMVTLPASQARSGILTQAGLLSALAHPDQTSPVLRGKFIRSKFLCQPPPPPPDNADITPPELSEGATARVRFSAHMNSGAGCNACHRFMDPIGFAFENFDAVGRFRTQESNQPIDASGEVVGATDASLGGKFTGVRELAEKLAQSSQAQNCLVAQWFRFASGRSDDQSDSCSIATLQDTFSRSSGDLVELVVGMTQVDSFLFRSPVAP